MINTQEMERMFFQHIYQIVDERTKTVEVNLYIASKNYRLKKINLAEIKKDIRSEKLEKWNKGNRFVLVVKSIDGNVYAHAHSEMANLLKEKPLTINGKNVTIEALSDEDYARLSLAANLLNENLLTKENEKSNTKNRNSLKSSHSQTKDSSRHSIIKNKAPQKQPVDYLDCLLTEIIKKTAQEFNERARLEKKEADEAEQKKKIMREILKKEINEQEIQISIVKELIEKSRS